MNKTTIETENGEVMSVIPLKVPIGCSDDVVWINTFGGVTLGLDSLAKLRAALDQAEDAYRERHGLPPRNVAVNASTAEGDPRAIQRQKTPARGKRKR